MLCTCFIQITINIYYRYSLCKALSSYYNSLTDNAAKPFCMLIADIDKGCELKKQIQDLEELLYAYRHGMSSEQDDKKGFIND